MNIIQQPSIRMQIRAYHPKSENIKTLTLVMEIHLTQKIQNSKNFKHANLKNVENVYDSKQG